MPLQSTSGAASYDAFGGGAAAKVNYIEDFFQSYLRTGTGASATVTTGLDGSTKETLVWTKSRSAATNHKLTDNVRGATKALSSNTTGAEATDSQGLTAFSATGYTLGTNTDYNNSGATYVDWQWVAQPKFFDVVTYTGTGSAGMVNHNLGSTPGMIIYKNITTANNWCVYHRDISPTSALFLNKTFAAGASPDYFGSQSATSTQFPIGNNDLTNTNGDTYVAYLFAHNAGGFGLTGTDNVISCGSYTGNGSSTGPTVTLGYEPQWLLIKRATGGTNDWVLVDNMRGFSLTGNAFLYPDLSNAESSGISATSPTATGFQINTAGSNWNTNGDTYIYIAIRRGPMKVPTSGTSVFVPSTSTQTSGALVTSGFPVDAFITATRNASPAGFNSEFYGRLQGGGYYLKTSATDAEAYSGVPAMFQYNTGVAPARFDNQPLTLMFKRAPSFFDEVCYTGTGSARTVTHNLTVAPELIIVKCRNEAGWNGAVYASGSAGTLLLDQTSAAYTSGYYAGCFTSTSSTTFGVNTIGEVNKSANTYVAYLFATCAGVSKVGSYTGNGTTQTINCGFTGGARFVLIKRTDSTGDWYVYDTARGMTTLTDPYLLLNSTAAESATLGSVTTVSTGFAVNASILAAINTNGASYIFLAIA